MIVPKYFEDFDHLHVNTMPNRAYYIPASRRMEDLVENREASWTAFSCFPATGNFAILPVFTM